jgi:uncharacterized protein YgbK (DUF1537 family)
MIKCVVIADDLTGANATGVLLREKGYLTSTILNVDPEELQRLDATECVTFTTDSRGVDKDTAYERVYNVAKLFKDQPLAFLNKRIDSTLRGNLGSETDAALDALGEDYTAIVVPCTPASGRVTIGGYMTVGGIILHKTEAALDPKTPIQDPRVQKLFEQQTRYPVASILIKDLDRGKEWLANEISLLAHEGNRTIIFDAITQEDINLISEAVIASKIKFVAVDPGTFTATLASKLMVSRKATGNKKILVVQGSVNPVAKTQMENFWLAQQVFNVYVKTQKLIESPEAQQEEIDRVVKMVVGRIDRYALFSVTGDGIQPENRLDLPQCAKKFNTSVNTISDRINFSMAKIAHHIMEQVPSIQGVYTSGGDVTAAFCKSCHTLGLKLLSEPVSLAAGGMLIAGDFPDKHIVTKGGMTGDPDAINMCIAKLMAELNM